MRRAVTTAALLVLAAGCGSEAEEPRQLPEPSGPPIVQQVEGNEAEASNEARPR
ncbi:MAG TPA: hypothetical protein VNT25_06885 [Allosphingosinicella sp.]|nr:hypothetical protein [Allosphingosinicella sp.]